MAFLFLLVIIFLFFLISRIHTDEGTSYEAALNDDRWRRKREKILERDHHTCQYCGSHKDLQVHHKYYMRYPDGKFADPWDYPDEKLITLCETCHKKWHRKHKMKVYYRKWGVHYYENP